jgi:hypothetical protein
VAPEEAVEVFLCLEDAEAFVGEVRQDDPDLAAPLSIESVELDA